MMNKLSKNCWLMLILLSIAFFIRFYALFTVPLNWDEGDKVNCAKQISFNTKNLNLPIGDQAIKNPLMSVYLIKLGFTLFGENKSAGRLFFVFLGTLSLYFIYKLVEEGLGKEQGLLSLILLTFSQFHIGTSRLMDEDCLLLFFSALSMYFFFRAIHTKEKKWVYLTGITIGLGYLGKELILLLLPVFFIFLLSKKEYKSWFRRKESYLAFFLMLILMSPHLLWSIRNNLFNYVSEEAAKIGLSFRSFYLYFGEAFAWLAEKFGCFVYDVFDEKVFIKLAGNNLKFFSEISNEFPFIHWVLGLFIFAGFFYSLKRPHRNNTLIKFSLIMFAFIFIITSVFGTYSLLDHFWWASMTIYPGVILCSYMLVKLKERYRYFKFALLGLILYFAIRSLYFVNLPENQFAVPKSELYRYYIASAERYIKEGKIKEAANICKWIMSRRMEEKILKRAEEILSVCRLTQRNI